MIRLFQVLKDCSELLLLIMQPLNDPYFGLSLQETLASSLPVGSFQGTGTSNFLRNDLTKMN